jgi:TATA-binding protein-associated factor
VRDNDKALDDTPYWPFHYFMANLLNNLFDPNWEVRHGAAIGIRDLLKKHATGAGKIKLSPTTKELYDFRKQKFLTFGSKIIEEQEIKDIQALRNQQWLEDCAIRLICVLALDRFGDYVFDNAVAPVRETAAQALGMVVRHVPTERLSNIIEALSCLEASPEWQVRHSGFLGVKYLITVWSFEESVATHILKTQLPTILSGLQDLEDDVRLVSADCLIPTVDILVKLPPEQISCTVATLWDAFLEIDDLTASTTSVTKLLSLIYTRIDPAIAQGVSTQTLDQWVPRLWPFFRHTILAVRKGVVTTLLRLIQSGNCKSWVEPVLESLLKLVFQNIVLDVDQSLADMSFELWRLLVENLDSSVLQNACVNELPKWFGLLNTPNGTPISRENLFVVVHSNSLGGGDTGAPLCDKVLSDPIMRIMGSQCLGILASKWQTMLVGGQPVNHMHVYFSQLLTCGSATSRQV